MNIMQIMQNMSVMKNLSRRALVAVSLIATVALSGCGGSSSGGGTAAPTVPVQQAPEDITVVGALLDGEVDGGRLFFFSFDQIDAALAAAEAATDRRAALEGVASIAAVDPAGPGGYTVTLPGELAGEPVFIVFDNAGADDATFGDTPFNMESVLVLGSAGSIERGNVTPHTTLLARQVMLAAPPSAAAVADAIVVANANVIAAFGRNELGEPLFEAGADVVRERGPDVLLAASTFVGALVRAASTSGDLGRAEVLDALAADALDGSSDGVVPADANVSQDVIDRAQVVDTVQSLGDPAGEPVMTGSCASTATLLKRACDVDSMDDFLEGVAVCQDGPVGSLDDCVDEQRAERMETVDECSAVYAARAALCVDLGDSVHEPDFGPEFAQNFVDPRDIGRDVAPNPWFPLVAGNEWVYEAEFMDEGELVSETITVTVLTDTKLIDGVRCVVVKDVVEEDGELIEDTDDWFAQDTAGNVWYCGEIARNYEYFDGDDPESAELVDLDGSWKAGREGAKAGILVPASPTVGSVIRNEVLYGDAEDVIEVMALDGDEGTDAADCDGACLVVREYTPLEPDAEEHTYHKAGVGVILEVDAETGDRAELVSFGNVADPAELANAKLLIEHNATDEDTGFQGFGDGEPWNELRIDAPDGTRIATAQALGGLAGFGLTELFFETSEPPNAEVPIATVVGRLAEGAYVFGGDLVGVGPATRSTPFTHDIPEGPELLSPAEDAAGVDPANVVVRWETVTADLDGDPVTIVGYQVIVEEEAPAFDDDGFAKPVLSVYLSAAATALTVPAEFMRADGCYEWEVLAIEASGNQTLSSSSFETGAGCDYEEPDDPEGLKAAKLLIEHNATDEDTGFQGFADGDPWNELAIVGPGDVDVLEVTPGGGLFGFGMTELFFETNEPPNDEMPIADVLARMPEGTYTFEAEHVDVDESEMTAVFTHTIPAAPVLLQPAHESEDVDPAATVVSWEPVAVDLDGNAITVVGYQVIVEEDLDEDEFPTGFAQPAFSVYLPPTVTAVTVPGEFMRADSDYEWEVFAIEDSGNQTLSSAEFSTRE